MVSERAAVHERALVDERPRVRHRAAMLTRRGERGFTLIEMLTVVVILGLIVAPLGTAAVQALTLVPGSSDRALHSARETIATQTFGHDVALAATSPEIVAVDGRAACAATGTTGLVRFTRDWDRAGTSDDVTITYALAFATPAPGARPEVRLTRQFGGGTPTTLLAGWCDPAPGGPPVATALLSEGGSGILHDDLQLAVRVAPTRSADARPITLAGSMLATKALSPP